MTRRFWTMVFGAALVAAACSDSTNPGGGGGGPAANEVFLQGTAFSPTPRTVSAGTQVTWVNKDNLAHNVTSSSVPAGASAFGSANLSLNGTFQVTLTVPGTYQYFCSIHGTAATGMRGTVVVN